MIGVAIVGVLAVNALSGARALPDLLSSAGLSPKPPVRPPRADKGKKTTPVDATTQIATPAVSPLPPAVSPGAPVVGPVCSPSATDLAKSAGLSPAELQVLQSLRPGAGQIDQREQDLDTQTQLLNAAAAKLDAKLKTMADLKAQIEALMGQADAKTQSEVDRLTLVYAKMKPADAAPLLATLDDKVRIPLAAQLEKSKPKLLADILSKMAPPDAKHLTELLARPLRSDPATRPGCGPRRLLRLQTARPRPPSQTPQRLTPSRPTQPRADPTAPAPKAKAAPAKAKHVAPKKKVLAKAKPKPKAKPVEEAKVDAPKGPQPYASLKKTDDAKPAPTPAATDKKAASPTR